MKLCSPIRLGLLNTKTSSPAGASFRLQKQPIFEILSDFPTLVTEGPSLLSNWHMAAIILKKEITGHNKAVGTDASCFLMSVFPSQDHCILCYYTADKSPFRL